MLIVIKFHLCFVDQATAQVKQQRPNALRTVIDSQQKFVMHVEAPHGGHVVTWTGLAGCSAPQSAPDSEQLRPASVRRPNPAPSDIAREYGAHDRDRPALTGCPILFAATGDRPDVPPPRAGRRCAAPATRFACRARSRNRRSQPLRRIVLP